MHKKRAGFFLAASAIFFVAFAFFSWFVHMDTTGAFDVAATRSIQGTIPHALDPFLSIFSLLGSFELVTLILLVCFLAIRNIRYAGVFALYTAGHFVELFGKKTIVHPGPPQEYFRYSLRFFLPTAHIRSNFAYPSGHTFRTVFVAFIIAFLILRARRFSPVQKRWTVVGIFMFLIIMIVSRISLGEHWTSDVIGGTALAISFAFLSFSLLEFPFAKINLKNKNRQIKSHGSNQ